MKFFQAAALALLFGAAPAVAQDRAQQAPPKLVVAISVDQFSADLFAQYRQHFTGGLKRLSEGVVFPSGYQAHAATETCPGHSTILTGSRPARTGIIANNWFAQGAARADKNVYCAEDERVPGSSSEKYTVSSYHLRVPALGDHMKRANPQSRVGVVSGKDRSAIMMGGYGPDQRWWWGGKDFVGASGATSAVSEINADVAGALARRKGPMDQPDLCRARGRSVAIEGGGKPVGAGRFEREAGDSRAFRASPELDAATLALAGAVRRDMKLGEGQATDLLVIGLSATDYVGHYYGTQGSEMCLQMLALDRALGDFFASLDRTGVDYLVMLTADHGGVDIPERQRQNGVPEAARVDSALDVAAVGKAIGSRLRLRGPVLLGEFASGDMYIDRALSPRQHRRVLAEALRVYGSHPQVAAVLTAAQIQAAPAVVGPPETWSLLQRAKASYDPERSGDFIVFLKPRVSSIYDTGHGYVSAHGSIWDYDRRVPIMFWRKRLTPFEQPMSVETVDILPTLASLLGVSITAGTIDGRCLDILEGPSSNCQ